MQTHPREQKIAIAKRAVAFQFHPAGVTAVAALHTLFGFATGERDLGGVGDDDIVAAVNVRCVLRAMLAHEDGGHLRGESAENLVLCVDMSPAGLDITGFGKSRLPWHDPT